MKKHKDVRTIEELKALAVELLNAEWLRWVTPLEADCADGRCGEAPVAEYVRGCMDGLVTSALGVERNTWSRKWELSGGGNGRRDALQRAVEARAAVLAEEFCTGLHDSLTTREKTQLQKVARRAYIDKLSYSAQKAAEAKAEQDIAKFLGGDWEAEP